MLRAATIAAVILTLGACSGDSGGGTSETNNGWELNNPTNGATNAGTNGTQNASNVVPNNTSGSNVGNTNSTMNNSGANNGTTNNTSTNNASTNNTSTNNSNTNSSTGGLAEGEPCELNSQCAGGTCCAGFDGEGTCDSECIYGGLCGGDQSECPADTECCDLSDVGGQPACLQQCGGGDNMGMACDTNADCGMGEVCCPGFDGSGTCEPSDSCFTGGICETDMDCESAEMCCDFSVGKVCLSQCSF